MNADASSSSREFRFESPRQDRIHKRLLTLGPGPAAFFQDACRLMADPRPLGATTHLVAHLLREIESALRDVLESVVDREARARKAAARGGDTHKDEIVAILKALKIPETDAIAVAWLLLPGKENAYGLSARAHRQDLSHPRPLDDTFREFWEGMQVIFDAVLAEFEKRFTDWLQVLDGLLAKDLPTDEDLKMLRNNVPNNVVAFGHFFDNLKRTEWLKPLREEGFFNHPPDALHDEERGTISFPLWPQSRFLARIAGDSREVAERVLAIIERVPSTDNARVYGDFTDAAINMPAGIAAKLAPKVAGWLQARPVFLLPDKLGTLASHLARGNEVEAALEVAKELLAVLPDPRAGDKSKGEPDYPLLPEAAARMDLWEYGEILRKNVPDILDAAGIQMLELLAGLLEEAIDCSTRESGPNEEDYSYIWRAAIDDQNRAYPYGVKDVLVTGVRDAADHLMAKDPSILPQIVYVLEGHRLDIFRRIILNLLKFNVRSLDQELLTKYVKDRDLFGNTRVLHEYEALVSSAFSLLSEADQEEMLSWIEDGPDRQAFREGHRKMTERDPTEEEIETYADRWRRDRLAPIKEHLPADWVKRFESLVETLGGAEPDEPLHGATWVGPTSPQSIDEIRSMTVEELVQFLREWQPNEDWRAPSAEGLGRHVTSVVSENPERYASQAALFKHLQPTYVRGLIGGFVEAKRQQRLFPWENVIQLCGWVVDEAEEPSTTETQDDDQDPGWLWTRKEIVRLIRSGCQPGVGEIPFVLRESVWAVLGPLTEDSQPGSEAEANSVSESHPYERAINMLRSDALECVVNYGLWVRRNQEASGPSRGSFEDMPEVRGVMDAHLDKERDPSLAVRSIYGRELPWLILLDRSWVESHLSEILPEGPQSRPFYDAAWETYVGFCPPFDTPFEVLNEHYGKAVDSIGTRRAPNRISEGADEKLAEHLMTYFWQGRLPLTDEDGLVRRFFSKASPELRGHALDFIGRTVTNSSEVPEGIITRVRELWTERLKAAKASSDKQNFVSELESFGWWFISGKFDAVWALEQLLEALTMARKMEASHSLAEHLAVRAQDSPDQVIRCFRLLVEGDDEGWNVLGWRDDLRLAISTAMASENEPAKSEAIELVNILCARGYLEFRDLLSYSSDPQR